MTTPSEGETKPNAKQGETWTPPRGVRLLDLPNRPNKPYGVQWRVPVPGKKGEPATTKPKTKSFPTREQQIKFAKAVAGSLRTDGMASIRHNEDELREWRAFRADIGQNVPLESVLACWRRHGSAEAAASPLVEDLVKRYLSFRETENRWNKSVLTHAKAHLRRFVERFGKRRVITVTREDIRDFLYGTADEDTGERVGQLLGRNGEPLGEHAQIDHRKNISLFLAHCVAHRWGVLNNECDYVQIPKVEDGDPVVIPIRDAFEFFKANRDERLIGRIALEAFGFVRFTTAGKLQKDALDFDRRGIRMAARIHKVGQRDGRSRYRQGHPANLWAWLKHAPTECWEMSLRDYTEDKRRAWIRAKLRPLSIETEADEEKVNGLRNVWRHSAISYHLAYFQAPGLTQRLAQHSSFSQTEEYEGMADYESGGRYSLLTPETVLLSWEDFCALAIPKPTPQADTAALQAV